MTSSLLVVYLFILDNTVYLEANNIHIYLPGRHLSDQCEPRHSMSITSTSTSTAQSAAISHLQGPPRLFPPHQVKTRNRTSREMEMAKENKTVTVNEITAQGQCNSVPV